MFYKTKKTSLNKLDDKLWKIFSKYIRLRDCNKKGLIKCISCGKFKPWKESDAGHFISRRKKATKFNEKNVNAQCVYCNRFDQGSQYAHSKAIDRKYGEGTAEYLYNLSQVLTKLTRDWYEDTIKIYKEKTKKREKELGII